MMKRYEYIQKLASALREIPQKFVYDKQTLVLGLSPCKVEYKFKKKVMFTFNGKTSLEAIEKALIFIKMFDQNK